MALPLLTGRPRPAATTAAAEEHAPPATGVVAFAFGLAAAFALLTGLTEAGLLTVARFYIGHMTHTTPQVVWLAPIAYFLLFAVPAAVFALLGLARPGGIWLPALVGLLALVSGYSVLQLAPGIADIARAVLAAGVAVRVATLVRRFERPVRRWTPRLVALLALISFGVGAGYNVLRAVRERRAIAALPAARAGAPNVLLLIWDTVRARSLSLYGYARPTTPGLQRLAASGVVFDDAMSAAPWTLTSHAVMFTGRWPHELSANWRTPLDGRYPTLAEVLDRAGYATAGFVGNIHYTAAENGLARGMVHFEDYRFFSPTDLAMSTALGRRIAGARRQKGVVGKLEIDALKTADEIDGDFLRWLDRRPSRHPFFAFLNLFDAHGPYLPPPAYAERFRTTPFPPPPLMAENGWKLTPQQVRAEQDAYDACIAYLDAQVTALTDSLRARGLLDNTIVVVVADHGEEFGEHGVFEHGNSLYVPALHVPLLVIAPGAPRGVRVAATASLRDLPATILDLAGQAPGGISGESLARFWRAPAGADGAQPYVAEVSHATGLPDRYPVSAGDLQSVFAGGFHLIRNPGGREELYDLRSDPMEKHDLRGVVASTRTPKAGS